MKLFFVFCLKRNARKRPVNLCLRPAIHYSYSRVDTRRRIRRADCRRADGVEWATRRRRCKLQTPLLPHNRVSQRLLLASRATMSESGHGLFYEYSSWRLNSTREAIHCSVRLGDRREAATSVRGADSGAGVARVCRHSLHVECWRAALPGAAQRTATLCTPLIT